MTEIKRPRPIPHKHAALHAHAARDMHRGFQTKNLIKGAQGGARGVDFQDYEAEAAERKAKPGANPEAAATASGLDPSQESADTAGRQQAAQDASAAMDRAASEIVPQDVVQNQREQNVVHEREEEERQKKKQQHRQQEEQPEEHEETTAQASLEFSIEPENDAVRQQQLSSIARLLADPLAEHRAYGAVVLQDPAEIRKTMGTPTRVAKHLLVLAGRKLDLQEPRVEVLEYLARTFLALGHEFGGRAFKDFGTNIGIGAIYPLEVREKILEIDDAFLKTTKCRFTAGRRVIKGMVKDIIVIEYPEDVMVTGFAVKGGGRQGYQMAPLKERGKHGLRLFKPGEYKLLLMGTDSMGFERLEEITIMVEGPVEVAKVAPVAAPAVRRNFRYNFNKQ